jgi:HSP20 family molecular chaperone IbpA
MRPYYDPDTLYDQLFNMDPLNLMRALRREFLSLPEVRGHRTYRVSITDDDVRLLVNVPGYQAEEITLTDDDGQIKVMGRGDHLGTFRAPEDVDCAGITANIENGVLLITMPRQHRPEPRLIPVRAGGVAALTTAEVAGSQGSSLE